MTTGNHAFETRPEVQILNGADPGETRIFINGQEWSQWTTAIKADVLANDLTTVTISFVAKLVGNSEGVDISV